MRERELKESSSRRYTGPQVEGQGYQTTVNISYLELFLSKRNSGTKKENTLKERLSGDQPKLGIISCGGGGSWHQSLYYY